MNPVLILADWRKMSWVTSMRREMTYHNPVLPLACVEGLNLRPDGTYVDATLGGGGHTRLILSNLGTNGRLLAFDQDPDAHHNAPSDARFELIPQNFRHLYSFLRIKKALPVQGILADLGVSSHQFDEANRGFSLIHNGPLDMRMNPTAGVSATELLQDATFEELAPWLRNYGEIPQAARYANAILRYRDTQGLETTHQLVAALKPLLPRNKEHATLARVFQAIRIVVNDELKALEEFLVGAFEALEPGGRLVVISYHSLEDRLVKNFFKEGKLTGEADRDDFGNRLVGWTPITKKPIVPDAAEIEGNSRARSAKLRIAEKRKL
jgi:16S rRNA (cytosine1402-N4)-methyltransferase